MTTYQQLIATATNRSVVQLTDNGSTTLQVVGLGTKMGDLKGNKVPYVVMKDDVANVVMLHPRDAAKLFSQGDAKEFLFDDFASDNHVDPVSVTEAKVVKEAKQKVVAEQQPTTKDKAATIYREMLTSGLKRKDFIQRVMAELGMTVRGAETYYSNFHRVNHAWHIAA